MASLRVDSSELQAKIRGIEYFRPEQVPHVTIAIVHTLSGYAVIGHSIPNDPATFDRETGERLAREDAMRKLFPLEAYAQRERLNEAV